VVLVATTKALKMHGGVNKKELDKENVDALILGIENLERHIETIKTFGLPYVVAINSFIQDTKRETAVLEEYLRDRYHPYSLSEVWEKGGAGAVNLAKKIINEIDTKDNNFARLYQPKDRLEDKIKTIAQNVYGADDVEFSPTAKRQLRYFKKLGWDHLGICMAKTQYSLTDNPKKLGRPKGFTITIRELTPSIGAGFIVALTGDVMTMPGLPKTPAALNMDVTKDGEAKGLF